MSIASALPPLNVRPTTPAAPAAKEAVSNKPPVALLSSTGSLPLRTPPNQVLIRPLEILQQPSPALSANVETVISEFAEVFVGHEHIKPKTNSSEKTPFLKLDGLPLSDAETEQFVGALEEETVAAEETHAKKRKGKHESWHDVLDMSKHGMDIALDIMSLIPFAGSVASGIHLAGTIWTILNRTSDAAQAVKHKLHPEKTKKEDSVQRMVRIGHDVLGIAGEILGIFPGLGIIGGAISLANDVAKLVEKHVENQKSSLV